MTQEVSELLKKALALPPEARAALAGSLLESLDDTVDASAEEEWNQEIARRIRELDSAKVKPILGPKRAVRSGKPDRLQHSRPVSADHKPYLLIGVATPYQRRSQFIHPRRSAEPRDHLVLTMHVITRIGFRQHIFQDRWRTQVVALDPGVGADADVLDTDEIAHVVIVINHILDGDRFAPFDHECNVGDSHDAALCGQLANGVVGSGAECVWIQGATIAV